MESNLAIRSAMPSPGPLPPLQSSARGPDPAAISKSFETMFASMLIKQMRQTLDEGLFGNDPSDVLGGLFDQFLGEHMAQAGGFGIGEMIRSQIERQPERTHTT